MRVTRGCRVEQDQLIAHLGADVTLIGRLAPAPNLSLPRALAPFSQATASPPSTSTRRGSKPPAAGWGPAAAYAIKAGMTVDDLASTWALYLTMSGSLRLVAGLFRDQIPTSCCA